MLTKAQLQELDDYMDTIKVGFRCICSFCQAELPHSDRSATKISHGMCSPLCEPAKAMGWGDVTKPTLGAASLVIGAAIVMLSFVSCAHANEFRESLRIADVRVAPLTHGVASMPPCQSWNRFLDALATVESNNNPNAIGDNGKSLGAYQIQLAVWQDVNKSRGVGAKLPFGTGSHGIHARDFAFSHLTNLHARLVKVGITPTCANMYAAWNLGFTGFKRRGFEISRCPATTQRAAVKINNLMK
jgi:hypothetical protein